MHLPHFYGRDAELKWLLGLWEGCAQRELPRGKFTGGPRMAFIVADSGIGKSRLVQALYQQLSRDPKWNPPESNYWPDSFNDQGVQIRVTPDMTGHTALGPPGFTWLGARWQATDVRNFSDRMTVLPELRSWLMSHAEILQQHGSTWQAAKARLRKELLPAVTDEGVGKVAEFAAEQIAKTVVPFTGLLVKLIKGSKELISDRMAGPQSLESEQKDGLQSLADEVFDCMHLLLDGPAAVPTVLWLDDAQWIDASSLEFLRRTWLTAQRRKWPLLIVVTHWEHSWLELKRSGEPGTLPVFEGQPGVEVRYVVPADPMALETYVSAHLAGLTPPQRHLLLDKAAGNFLTMVENVGFLLRTPANFVGKNISSALAPVGEKKVREWESERQKRVEQRFSQLTPDLQSLLGWGSYLGLSFLREVIEEFAHTIGVGPVVAAHLKECVDPLAILGAQNELMREFRDRAFHTVAARHFADYDREHDSVLRGILHRRLVEWVNHSFHASGNVLWPDKSRGVEAPPRSVTGLPADQRRAMLVMACRELHLSLGTTFMDPVSIAALRARHLFACCAAEEKLWDHVREVTAELKPVDWSGLPIDQKILSPEELNRLAELGEISGRLECALGIWRFLLMRCRWIADAFGWPRVRRDVGFALIKVADIEAALGDLGRELCPRTDLDHALALYQESLAIFRTLAVELGTPESRRDLSVSLNRIGGIERARGDLEGALARYQESLAIDRALADELGTAESRRDANISLAMVVDFEAARCDLDGALARYQESLAIARALTAELGTPESRRDVSVSLDRVGGIEEWRGDYGGALAYYQESLTIRRALADELGTPHSRRDVSISLSLVAGNEAGRERNLEGALAHYQESLAIRRGLADELGTPASQWNVVDDSRALIICSTNRARTLLFRDRAIEALQCLKLGEPEARSLEDFSRSRANFSDTLAAFWEEFAEAEREVGNLAATQACAATASTWRENERSLRESDYPESREDDTAAS